MHAGSSSPLDDDDVVELSPAAVLASHCGQSGPSLHKRKRTKVIPENVVYIDEDDDPDAVVIIEKASVLKGKQHVEQAISARQSNQPTGYTMNRLTKWEELSQVAVGGSLFSTQPGQTAMDMNNYLRSMKMGPLKDSASSASTSPPFPHHNIYMEDIAGASTSYHPFMNNVPKWSIAGASSNIAQPPPNFFPGNIPAFSTSRSFSSYVEGGYASYDDSIFVGDNFLDLGEISGQGSFENYGNSIMASNILPGGGLVSETLAPEPALARSSVEIKNDGIKEKYRLFKQFDTVDDHSDHKFSSPGKSGVPVVTKPLKDWAKRIQHEWKVLEKDLPETIYVRIYEGRMDLLRAVIVGPEGTPYHDGLFFFDIYFPPKYPHTPPLVHYHSGGLRLNPNLYENGKVCLSLLNTWSGQKCEMWNPSKSTMLQVLVSIQALVLNSKPYFNEPGYAKLANTPAGEQKALDYNENTFLLSCKTMLYSLRNPPKHFESLVAGHFLEHGHKILVACRAYMQGAQVGCLVGEGVQDLEEGDKSCSLNFKALLRKHVEELMKEFSSKGVNCDGFVMALKAEAGTGIAKANVMFKTGPKAAMGVAKGKGSTGIMKVKVPVKSNRGRTKWKAEKIADAMKLLSGSMSPPNHLQ